MESPKKSGKRKPTAAGSPSGWPSIGTKFGSGVDGWAFRWGNQCFQRVLQGGEILEVSSFQSFALFYYCCSFGLFNFWLVINTSTRSPIFKANLVILKCDLF